MTSPQVRPGAGLRELELGDRDATLRVAPADVVAVTPAPPAPDVARLPGARLVAFEVVRADAAVLQAGCVRAPSDRWVPGLEALIFERAMGLALAPTGLAPRGLARRATPELPGAFAAERWSGREGEGRSLEVLSVLAFVGPDADALACTVLCVEPLATEPEGAGTCASLVDRTELVGTLGPPPPPGLFARALLGAAEAPLLAAGMVGALAMGVVSLALATRPRRRPTASRAARARSR